MNLIHLTDKTLLQDTKHLVQKERESTTKILHHLKEIDKRKLFSELKCSSLFDYCVKVLGYSEASAQRRIVASRLLVSLPHIEEKIESGVLTLTNICQANQFFNSQDVVTPEFKENILNQIENLSKRDCEQKLFELSGKTIKTKEGKQRISKTQQKVSIVLDDDTLKEIEKLKALLGKNISMNELIKLMTKTTIEKVEKEKFKQTSVPKQNSRSLEKVKFKKTFREKKNVVSPQLKEFLAAEQDLFSATLTSHQRLSPVKPNRTLTNQVKREVYKRDKQCTNCGTKHRLNFDHRIPYALNGSNSAENIRLLCFHCNQRGRIRVKL